MLTANPTYGLRDYQTAAIESVENAFTLGQQRVAIVVPTGGGKTVIFSHLINRRPAGSRTLVLAHRDELINQAAEKIRAIVPDRSVGIVKGASDERDADIVVASVQSLRGRRLEEFDPRRFELLVIDEAHHAVAPTYRAILDHFSHAKALGVSATLVRSDDASLGDVWQEVVYQVDILDLIDAGHLCDVRGIRIVAEGLDLSKVKETGGDLQASSLADQMGEAGAWEVTVDAYMRHASDRRGVVFTPTVAAAHEVAALFAARGITAEAIDGGMPLEIRHGILDRVQRGVTQVVANAMVLTEGYDNPAISCVVIARPTVSEGLYVQMAGRGLRRAPGKTDCLILDIVGGSDGKSLATLADLTGHTVAEVEEGESLVEAKQRFEKAGDHLSSNTAAPYLGSLTEQEINLFSSSGVAWTTWQEQVRYINVTSTADSTWRGNLTIYIAPGATRGTYAVVWRHRETGLETPIADGISLPLAMRKAEKMAREWGGALVSRKWRPKLATDGQHRMAARFGIVLPSGATTRDASDLIDRAKVDPVIDRDFTKNPPRGYTPQITT